MLLSQYDLTEHRFHTRLEFKAVGSSRNLGEWFFPDGVLAVAKMIDTVFFSFVLYLGSQWGGEPHSIPVTEGVKNNFSSSSKHLDGDLAKLFDDIMLQVFTSNLDDVSKEARTAGRLITWRDVNETHLHLNSFNNSESASSSHTQEDHLAKIFVSLQQATSVCKSLVQTCEDTIPPRHLLTDQASCHTGLDNDEILLQVFSNDPKYLSKENGRAADELVMWRDVVNEAHIAEKMKKESSLFNRDVSHQLTTAAKETLQRLVIRDAHTESLPCRQLLSFLQKNIITASIAVAAILLVMVFLVLVLVTYIRRKQPRHPPGNMTYNIFIMNGKAWWQKSHEKHLKKFTGKQKPLKCSSCV